MSDVPIFWRADKRRYVFKYKAVDGSWAQKHCPPEYTKSMRAQARAWAKSWLASPENVRPEPRRRGSGLLMREAYHRFIAIMESEEGIAPSTLASYRTDFRAHVLGADGARPPEPRIDHREVADLATDYATLMAWFAALKKRVGVYRARDVFSTVRRFFDEAIVQRWVRGSNPFRNDAFIAKLPPLPTKREAPPVVVPIEHAQAVISDVRVPLARRVRYVVAFTSAKREGEIAGTTWGDLGLDAPVPFVDVEKARRLVRKKGEVLGDLKTRTSARTLPLHPAARAALLDWRDSRDGVAFYLGRTPEPADPVFPSGRYRTRAEFSRPQSARLLRGDLEMLELPTTGPKGRAITMQATRRSCLTYLERAGVPEAMRKIIAGHGFPDVTDRFYTENRELAELAGEVAKIPLVWPGAVVPDMVPPVVPGGTKEPSDDEATSGDDNEKCGTPGKSRTCDQRFRKARELGAVPAPTNGETVRGDAGDRVSNAGDPNNAFAEEPPSRPGTKRAHRVAPGVSAHIEKVRAAVVLQGAMWGALDAWAYAAEADEGASS